MLHRSFGNLDEVVQDTNPFVSKLNPIHRIGIVEEVDTKSFIIKVRDCQSGQRGILCTALSENFSVTDKSGCPSLPIPESQVLYILTGGNIGIILGNISRGIIDLKKKSTDEVSSNPGFENFVDSTSVFDGDMPSDFGWNAGDRGWINDRGKIKLTRAGIIILKSAPFCYQYMLPAKQARLSQFMYDEERGIGYLKRRKTFISPIPAMNYNANYKVEQIEDIPVAPRAVLRKETGFCDRMAAISSSNHQSEMDISGHVSASILGEIPILKTRCIERNIIAKTKKVVGERILFSPVYKEEKRVDGTTIEQIGHIPGSPVYNLEIIKSPLGYMHIIGRSGVIPKFILKLDPLLGSVEIHGDILAFTAKTMIAFNAPTMTFNSLIYQVNSLTNMSINSPIISLNGSLTSVGGLMNFQSLVPINFSAPSISLNAANSLALNAPSVSSLPVPVSPPPLAFSPIIVCPLPIIPITLPINTDNTIFDEVAVD
jgi:hypothetical protein